MLQLLRGSEEWSAHSAINLFAEISSLLPLAGSCEFFNILHKYNLRLLTVRCNRVVISSILNEHFYCIISQYFLWYHLKMLVVPAYQTVSTSCLICLWASQHIGLLHYAAVASGEKITILIGVIAVNFQF
jgi:hypothetical protein